MARSHSIHILIDATSTLPAEQTIIAAFTVKHEMESYILRNKLDKNNIIIHTVRDGK